MLGSKRGGRESLFFFFWISHARMRNFSEREKRRDMSLPYPPTCQRLQAEAGQRAEKQRYLSTLSHRPVGPTWLNIGSKGNSAAPLHSLQQACMQGPHAALFLLTHEQTSGREWPQQEASRKLPSLYETRRSRMKPDNGL
jgi:hypothetical protein